MTNEIVLPLDLQLPPSQVLLAGKLRMMYENGNLRYLRVGSEETIRKVYCAVRDHDWVTQEYVIENERILQEESSFTIHYTALYGNNPVLYRTEVRIEGTADSRVIYSVKGEALAPFSRNRIGICVLQPIKECIGQPVGVKRPDGSEYQSAFPTDLSPHQPMVDVAAQRWQTRSGVDVSLQFSGDSFETEDQRNWSDSSYKTYSTPLDLPVPVALNPGDRMEQQVVIAVIAASGPRQEEAGEITEEKMRLPGIGFSRAEHQPPLSPDLLELLQHIPFHHYRVRVNLSRPAWKQELEVALEEAFVLGTKLSLAIVFSGQYTAELDALLPELALSPELVDSLLLLQHDQVVSPPELLQAVYPQIKQRFPNIEVGYGTERYFANLNRNRPGDAPFDYLSFHLHPQVHATDNRTLVENLERQADLIATGMKFSNGKPVAVSPVSLKQEGGAADSRQQSWLAAYWSLMSIQNLAAARHLTLCELISPAGLITVEGMRYSPLYEVLVGLYNFEPKFIVRRWQNGQILMDGLLVENETGERLLFRPPAQWIDFREGL